MENAALSYLYTTWIITQAEYVNEFIGYCCCDFKCCGFQSGFLFL